MHSGHALFQSLVLLALASGTLAAAPWKLVLKDGRTLVCEAPPLVIDGSYVFRDLDGNDGNLTAEEIDLDKTAQANKTESKPQWREVGRAVRNPQPGQASAVGGNGRVLSLGESNFAAEVLRSRGPVLVDFSATWCGPCRRFAPTVDAIAAQFAGRAKVGKLDVDQSRAIAQRYGVHTYPTVLVFKDGAVVGKLVGGVAKSEVARLIEANL